VLIVALGTHVARVDAVLVQGPRSLRVLDQELMAVVVEVADERHADAQVVELAADLGDSRGGRVVVDGDAHQLGSRMCQRGHLQSRAVDIGGVGVGHRLDHDGVARADVHAPYIDGHGLPAPGQVCIALHQWPLGRARRHRRARAHPPPRRCMSK
jgi:hypothetical protein